ncbi:hypothetical protein [Streptomyces sp. NPDC093225]|uniref:hypothetical protein n=1 Tax=Streptomyces sp. NPDC093225 TaxID=3366034 RepID=UPI003827CE42
MFRTRIAQAAAVATFALAALVPALAAHATADQHTRTAATTVWETAPVGKAKPTTVWETATAGKATKPQATTVWE